MSDKLALTVSLHCRARDFSCRGLLGRCSQLRCSSSGVGPSATVGEMIEFLAKMPTDTKIFLTMAVLGLAAILIVLRRLI
jgi:hypothetical protein